MEGTFWKGVTDSEQCFTKSFICKTIILKNIEIPSNRYLKIMFGGGWEMECYVSFELASYHVPQHASCWACHVRTADLYEIHNG